MKFLRAFQLRWEMEQYLRAGDGGGGLSCLVRYSIVVYAALMSSNGVLS